MAGTFHDDSQTKYVRYKNKNKDVRFTDVYARNLILDTATAGNSVLDGFKLKVHAYAADGALTIASGVHKLTTAARAMTLAAPSAAQEGTIMWITAQFAGAHTVTQAAPGFNNGGAGADVATFGGAVGDSFVIVAVNGIWNVISLRNVTLA